MSTSDDISRIKEAVEHYYATRGLTVPNGIIYHFGKDAVYSVRTVEPLAVILLPPEENEDGKYIVVEK